MRGLYWGYETGSWSWSAIEAGGSYRGFFGPTAPAGGYWGVGAEALSLSADYSPTGGTTESASALFFGPKVEVGYRWLLGDKKNFAIGIGGEVGYYFGSIEILGEKMPFSGVAFGIPVSIGYAW